MSFWFVFQIRLKLYRSIWILCRYFDPEAKKANHTRRTNRVKPNVLIAKLPCTCSNPSICQDPANPRKRIYRVFKCIEDTKGSVEETGHQLRGSAKISNNKAIRDSLRAVITNKAAASTGDPLFGQLAIEDGRVDEPNPKRPKREPKKKTPEEEAALKKQRSFDGDMSESHLKLKRKQFDLSLRSHDVLILFGALIFRGSKVWARSCCQQDDHEGHQQPRGATAWLALSLDCEF